MAKVLWSKDGERWTANPVMRMKILRASRACSFSNRHEQAPIEIAKCWDELASLDDLPSGAKVVASGWISPAELTPFSVVGIEVELPDRRARVYAFHAPLEELARDASATRLCVTHSEHWIGLDRIPPARAAKIVEPR